jgi:hypothetical protein
MRWSATDHGAPKYLPPGVLSGENERATGNAENINSE